MPVKMHAAKFCTLWSLAIFILEVFAQTKEQYMLYNMLIKNKPFKNWTYMVQMNMEEVESQRHVKQPLHPQYNEHCSYTLKRECHKQLFWFYHFATYILNF